MTDAREPSTDTAPAGADDAPDRTFADLGLGERVLRALADVGYETPTSVQSATIPVLLEGRDLIGKAQTGTGKTAAFALPILDRLDLRQKTPQALVLAPTRELALQVCEAFERYASRTKGVHVLPVYGGQGYGVQLSALRRASTWWWAPRAGSWTTSTRGRSTCRRSRCSCSTRPTRC